ncbi:MAG: HIT family protein [Candidatus Aenigmarchaeota archaeon]|nr:HIT family protein [Candidatus Aenigmarchaeota archaeon]
MDDCIFCKILKKEIPSMRIYENEGAVAMLDVKPLAPGHSIVIPKSHIALVEDMKDKEMEHVFSAVRTVLQKVKNSDIKPHGFTIGINDGKAAHQFVPHVHVHIIPRFEKDGGGSVHTIVSNPPSMDLKTAFDMINKAEKEEEKAAVDKKNEEAPTHTASATAHRPETLEEKRRRLERQLGL